MDGLGEAKRVSPRLIALKIVANEKILSIISVYFQLNAKLIARNGKYINHGRF